MADPTELGCYRLTEDGGFRILENGIDFRITETCDIVQASNWKLWPDHDIKRRNDEYRAKVDEENRKQNEIIALKLEAQVLRAQEIELRKEKSKQAARQVKALEKEISQLMATIEKEMAILFEIQRQSMIYKRNIEFLVLLMASPFGSVSMM